MQRSVTFNCNRLPNLIWLTAHFLGKVINNPELLMSYCQKSAARLRDTNDVIFLVINLTTLNLSGENEDRRNLVLRLKYQSSNCST